MPLVIAEETEEKRAKRLSKEKKAYSHAKLAHKPGKKLNRKLTEDDKFEARRKSRR